MTTVDMTAPLAPAPAAPRRNALRLALAAIALIELVDAMAFFIIVPGGMSGLGTMVQLRLALHPVLALSALVFAATGYTRYAIPALGAIVLMDWLKYMALIPDGFDYGNLLVNLGNATEAFIFPIVGACAVVLAARGERLGIATMLIAIPTLVNLFNTLAFLIGVSIYGF